MGVPPLERSREWGRVGGGGTSRSWGSLPLERSREWGRHPADAGLREHPPAHTHAGTGSEPGQPRPHRLQIPVRRQPRVIQAQLRRTQPAGFGGVGREGAGAAAAKPQDRAAEINRRVSGWAYAIPQYKYDVLTRRMSDLLKPEEKAD